MKSVLISIKPQWCEKICHEIGKDENDKPIYEKRIEVRKTAPKEVPFKAYIYETYDKKYADIGICWGNGKCFEHGCQKQIGTGFVRKNFPHVLLRQIGKRSDSIRFSR